MDSPSATQQPTTARIGARFGLIAGLALIIFYVIVQVANLGQNQAVGAVSFVILLGMIIWAMRAFRTENGGTMTYGQTLGVGSFVGAVAGLMQGIFSALYMQFIDPGMRERLIAAQEAQFEAQGMSDEQIDQALRFASMFTSPTGALLSTAISLLILGFFMSLIAGIFIYKRKPDFE
jgi:hypothetical protein